MGIARNCAFILWTALAVTLPAGRGNAAPPERVTVEFLAKRSESTLEARNWMWSRRYSLSTAGDIEAMRRFRILSDAALGRDLAYASSGPFTRHVFLYVYSPDRTTFSTITKAVERLKAIIEKNVTGNCKVVIEVLPRDWVYANEPDAGEAVELAALENSSPKPAPVGSGGPAPNP